MPDQIIQYVGQKGYSKTFVQLTDPSLDPDNDVQYGDFWIVADSEDVGSFIWGSLRSETWADVKTQDWGIYAGNITMYSYAGPEKGWRLVYDRSEMAQAYTRIEQNEYAITAEAYRANAAEGELRASLQIAADAITAEVARATGAEGTIRTTLALDSSGKITLSSTNFSSLGNTTSGIYITPAKIDINSSGTLSVKSGGELAVASGGDLNINSGAALTVKSGGELAIASGGDLNINSGSNLTIKSGGSIAINSGGKFSLTSTYFKVANDGTITCTGGTIGGFTISTSNIHKNKDALYNYDNSSGIYIGTNGISLGRGGSGTTADPYHNMFTVTSAGKLTAQNAEITGKLIANTGNLGSSTGFTIATNKIYKNQTTYDGSASGDTAGVYIGTNGIGLGKGNFYVTSSGNLYANSGEFQGKVYLSKLVFQSPDGSTVTIDGSKLTDGTVPKSKNTTTVQNNITNGQTAYNTITDMVQGNLTASYIKADKLWVGTGKINMDNTSMGRIMVTIGSTSYYVIGKSI